MAYSGFHASVAIVDGIANSAVPRRAEGAGVTGRSAPKECLECGRPFASAMPHGEFCTTPCRRAWNNRRATRGAAVYDLFMATRYQRDLVGPLKLWRALNRLAAQHREEDRAQRAGRRSWATPQDVIARHPWLNAVTGIIRGGRGARRPSN